MSKIQLDNVDASTNVSVINTNFQKIEEELQNKVLYRDNPVGEPNTLENDIDANGRSIFNVNTIMLTDDLKIQGKSVYSEVVDAAEVAKTSREAVEAVGIIAQDILDSATEAIASGAIATTKANEAIASAASTLADKNIVITARDITTAARDVTTAARDTAVAAKDTAVTKAAEASASALSVVPSNLMHLTGNESAAGTKTFSTGVVVASQNSGQLAGMRNKLINGKMEFAQGGTSFPAAAGYTLDMWRADVVASPALFTVTQSTDVPTGSEFQYSLRATITTADTSITATEVAAIVQYIEGYNVRDLIGNPFTISFRVRSPKTGIHCVSFVNGSPWDRSYTTEYTVNTANTWETKSITVPGGLITAGTGWNWTTGQGLGVRFALAAGSNFHTTKDAWQTGNYLATSSQVNCLDTVGNIFAITGVQLEKGTVATPYEHRDIGLEFSLCQRHYCTGSYSILFGAYTAGAVGADIVRFPVTMRATPTIIANTGYISNAGTVTNNLTDWNLTRFHTTANAAGQVESSGTFTASARL